MLKRQRPATPPPSSLGDPPSTLPIRPLQPLHAIDPSHPRSKRQRTQPPPLDGALRGWLHSECAGTHRESDGEEDWIEDPHTIQESPTPPSTTTSQYKNTNSLLHELHILNQHRLLSPRDRRLNPSPRTPLLMEDAAVGHRPVAWTNGSPHHPTPLPFTRDELAGQSCCIVPVEEKGLVEEVRYVRQHYEGANKLLGSLFLSRRREVERVSFADSGPSG